MWESKAKALKMKQKEMLELTLGGKIRVTLNESYSNENGHYSINTKGDIMIAFER